MQLQAASIGYAVPRESFDATIQSVFDFAANLQLEDVNGLITVFTANHDLPQGIRLESKAFRLSHLKVGQQAICREGQLHLPGLTINMRGAHQWRCDLSELNVDTTNTRTTAACRSVWDALNERQSCMGAGIIARNLFDEAAEGSPFDKRITANVKSLLAATPQFDLPLACSAVEGLIGLGPGVTPSGDDILLGYLAGLWSTLANQTDRVSFLSSFGERLLLLAAKTNDISRTYLYHATQGQLSSGLIDLIEAIARGDSREESMAVVQGAMSVGYSSGMDTVTGLLLGLVAWNSSLIPTLCEVA